MSDNSPAPDGPNRATAAPRWKRIAKVLLACGAVLTIGTYFALHALVELPPVSGSYPVGQRAVVFHDPDRADPWSGETSRELLVYAFYPAAEKGRPVSYFPNLSRLAGNFAGADALLVRLLPVFLTPSASQDVPLAATPERLTVVVFSPGANSAVFFYRTLLEDLASHGYLVLAVEPTHEGVGQVFPAGRVVEPIASRQQPDFKDSAAVERHYRQRVDVRAGDLALVARQLSDEALRAICPEWVGRIDERRIASLGHSLGGVAAIEAARREPRLVAGANLDGHFKDFPCLPDAEPVARHAAMLIIEDESPQQRASAKQPDDKAANEALARWQAHQTEVEAHLTQTFRHQDKLLLHDMQHSDFSDQPFFYPYWKASAWHDNVRRLNSIRDKLREFLQRQSRQDSTEEVGNNEASRVE